MGDVFNIYKNIELKIVLMGDGDVVVILCWDLLVFEVVKVWVWNKFLKFNLKGNIEEEKDSVLKILINV